MKFEKNNTRSSVFCLLILSTLLIQSCAETGGSTKVAAATGGALGASIGALIGNQTGNTSEGLLVGAVAGAGAGAAVGAALDKQDDIIEQRNESIERQGRQIAVQQSELQELRRLSSDNIRYRGGSSNDAIGNSSDSINSASSGMSENSLNNSYANNIAPNRMVNRIVPQGNSLDTNRYDNNRYNNRYDSGNSLRDNSLTRQNLGNQIRAEVNNQDLSNQMDSNQMHAQVDSSVSDSERQNPERQYANLDELNHKANANSVARQPLFADAKTAYGSDLNAQDSRGQAGTLDTGSFNRQQLLNEQRQASFRNDTATNLGFAKSTDQQNVNSGSIVEQARNRGSQLNTNGRMQIADLSEPVKNQPALVQVDQNLARVANNNNNDVKGAFRWDDAKAKAAANAATIAELDKNKHVTESRKTIKSGVEIIKKETPPSAECSEAKKEYDSAVESQEIADKLYHYRRALRLCPENPGFHTGLGKVYMTLNRNEDASYELNEALRIDPQFRPALEQLRLIKK